MTETRLFEAEDALEAILREAPELQGVTITNSAEPERAGEYVWIYRGAATRSFRVVGGGPPPLDEDITLQMRIMVALAQGSRERARELFEAVSAALRESASLEGATVVFSLIETLSAEQVSLDGKLGYHIPMTLKARTRT